MCFGSAHGEDEGISLNQAAFAVNVRHRAEGERERYLTQTRREGDSAPTGKTLSAMFMCQLKKKKNPLGPD